VKPAKARKIESPKAELSALLLGLRIGRAMVWVCVDCETARNCGCAPLNLPLSEIDRTDKQLKCLRCHQVTRHEFFEVSRGHGARKQT
jgi:hypothetical protein